MSNRLSARRRRSAPALPSALLALLCAAAVASASASAAVTGFPCSVTNSTSGAGLTSLGAALAAARAGDTLNIHGTCVGNFTVTVPLTLVGGPSATLDGSGKGPVLTLDASGTVNLNVLRITGGSATTGAGIAAGNNSQLTLNMLYDRVTGNHASVAGAGLYTGRIAALNIQKSAFTSDTISAGAQGAQGAAIDSAAPADLFETNVIGNSVTAPAGAAVLGGAVYLSGAATLDAIEVERTAVSGGKIEGAGLAAVDSINMIESTIAGNTATSSAGPVLGVGLYAGGQSAQIATTAIDGNVAQTGSGEIRGAGIGLAGGTALQLSKSSVAANRASSSTGAIAGVGIDGGAVTLTNSGIDANRGSSTSGAVAGGGVAPGSSLAMTGGLVTGNSVSSSRASGDGGGIWTNMKATVSSARISANLASTAGGGVFVSGAPLTVTGSGIVGNSAPAGAGIDNVGGTVSAIASRIVGCLGCG